MHKVHLPSSAGFMLIEILVTLLVISIGVLAITGMLFHSIQLSDELLLRDVANYETSSALNQILVAEDLATLDPWQQAVDSRLPDGQTWIAQQNDVLELGVAWRSREPYQIHINCDLSGHDVSEASQQCLLVAL